MAKSTEYWPLLPLTFQCVGATWRLFMTTCTVQYGTVLVLTCWKHISYEAANNEWLGKHHKCTAAAYLPDPCRSNVRGPSSWCSASLRCSYGILRPGECFQHLGQGQQGRRLCPKLSNSLFSVLFCSQELALLLYMASVEKTLRPKQGPK